VAALSPDPLIVDRRAAHWSVSWPSDSATKRDHIDQTELADQDDQPGDGKGCLPGLKEALNALATRPVVTLTGQCADSVRESAA
jgi:hypothetical protein